MQLPRVRPLPCKCYFTVFESNNRGSCSAKELSTAECIDPRPLCCMHAELRQMRHKADSDKKEAALADRTMQSIEAQAKKQYEQDVAAAQASASGIGDWVCSPPHEPSHAIQLQLN